jgi:ABC-type branched-subunit amino acid transport system substrate-binding protein
LKFYPILERRGEEMFTIRLAFTTLVVFMLIASSLFPVSAEATKTLYVGGTMALTGPYAEDTAAELAAFEDYVKYVNETKRMAPWRNEKFPADINLEVLWRDDMLQPAKALSIYEELKGKGMLVYRISSSAVALALKDRLNADNIGSTTMAAGPYLLTPPQTIFTSYPIYTDNFGAVADWFIENWKETRKPRVAYLTADNAMGKAMETPELEAYLKKLGFEFVGIQYVPLVPTTPPTTQLMWLKDKKVDLALGMMIDPGSQPTIKEAVRLDMGTRLGSKIAFAFCNSHLEVMIRSMGAELSEGVLMPGDLPPKDYLCGGIKFLNELQDRYRPNKKVTHVMYMHGMIEVMIQAEALRLALQEVPFEKIKPVDVLNYGFYKIKNFDIGELTNSPLTYSPGNIQGCNAVRLWQAQGGKMVKLGVWPIRYLYGK